MVGIHIPGLIAQLIFIIPWIIAFIWVRPDANRRGQPGWLWVLLALPLSWLALLAYVVVRAISDGMRAA